MQPQRIGPLCAQLTEAPAELVGHILRGGPTEEFQDGDVEADTARVDARLEGHLSQPASEGEIAARSRPASSWMSRAVRRSSRMSCRRRAPSSCRGCPAARAGACAMCCSASIRSWARSRWPGRAAGRRGWSTLAARTAARSSRRAAADRALVAAGGYGPAGPAGVVRRRGSQSSRRRRTGRGAPCHGGVICSRMSGASFRNGGAVGRMVARGRRGVPGLIRAGRSGVFGFGVGMRLSLPVNGG